MYKERDSLTSGYKITLDGLTCHQHQSIKRIRDKIQIRKVYRKCSMLLVADAGLKPKILKFFPLRSVRN